MGKALLWPALPLCPSEEKRAFGLEAEDAAQLQLGSATKEAPGGTQTPGHHPLGAGVEPRAQPMRTGLHIPVPVQPLRICVWTWTREKVDWVKAALSKRLNRALTFWSNDCSSFWRFRDGPARRTYFTSQRTHKLPGRTKRKSRAIPDGF